MMLSIIIVKYRCEEYLKKCLSSIKPDKRWEVIIVNNDKENVGLGAGWNKGASKSKGKYLFFLNPDTVVLDDALEKMLVFMEENPDIAVLGPKIYKNFKKEKQLSFCRFPDPLTSLFVFSPLKSFWPNNPLFTRYVYSENKKDNQTLAVEAVSGAAILIRKNVFKKSGGFDENIFLFFEENDLCRRIDKQGAKIVFFPKAQIIHFGGKSILGLKNPSEIFKKSRFYFFKKHYGKAVGIFIEGLIRILERVGKWDI
ncbi:hypothetical protein COT64_03245 [Candidatus Shapirobacteria bacterium CG09_land_8_20_14_0_10_39_12]|uniref:Glycosyltransferase 2-like prokaryotic type domain-containing protein n=1 Tax=Candidatus Shapirobacteria bacterium CG09_land_8_20_14_0_10_39_12 TaxID=1974885 RepID=A0A2H0WNV5_9BACT|nr:MAG: hypothetical protein COT64_03245 [Candidatus Shapirobacteria bacterium CG09_land_8_20_14_0_10_39_12]